MKTSVTKKDLTKKLQEKLKYVSNLKQLGFGTLFCENPVEFQDQERPLAKVLIAVGNPNSVADAKKYLLNSFGKSIDLDSSNDGCINNCLYMSLERDIKNIDDLSDDDMFDEPFSLM